jgi:hypothetical protein
MSDGKWVAALAGCIGIYIVSAVISNVPFGSLDYVVLGFATLCLGHAWLAWHRGRNED